MSKYLLFLILIISLNSYSQPLNTEWAIKGNNGYNATSASDGIGDVVITGDYSNGPIIFGLDTLSNSPGFNTYLAKYSTKGNLKWAKKIISGAFHKGLSIDKNGNIYLIGMFYSPTVVIGQDTLIRNGGNDFFILKYNKNGTLLWKKQYGGSGYDIAIGIDIDKNSDIVITGLFKSSSMTIDSVTLINSGEGDTFIMKCDSNGNLKWVNKIGGIGAEHGFDVKLDSKGNIIATGFFSSASVTIGSITLTNPDPTNSFSIYVVKYKSNGSLIWAKKSNGLGFKQPYSINTDVNDNIFIYGQFQNQINFDTSSLYYPAQWSNFLLKVDSSGNTKWLKYCGISSSGFNSVAGAGGIACDLNENVVITNTFSSSSISFGSTTLFNTGYINNSNNTDIYFVSFDKNGNVNWARSFGGNESDISSGLEIDLVGNIIISGYFSSNSIQFDSFVLTKVGSRTMFLASFPAYQNTIASNQTICAGSMTDSIVGSNKYNPDSKYIWIKYSDSLNTYIPVKSNGDKKNYLTDSLYKTTFFKRIIKTGLILDTSNYVKIDVLSKPVSYFNINNIHQCLNNQSIQFYESSYVNGLDTISDYHWDFGDSTFSILKKPIKQYVKPGRYKVKLKVTTNNNCSDTSVKYIEIFESPLTTISASDTFLCFSNNFIKFTDNTTFNNDSILNRLWRFGDGTYSQLKYPSKSYSTPGMYEVKLITITINGCVDSASKLITILNSPGSGNIAGPKSNLQPNTQYLYNINQQLNHTYEWQIENAAIVSGQGTNAITVQWLNNGIGKLKCILTNNNNCTDTARLEVSIGSTGINNKKSNIKIYPNPANNIINIEGLTKNENNTIQIFDVQGKLVITKTINEKGTIGLSELNKGVYVIKIGELAQRIVKM